MIIEPVYEQPMDAYGNPGLVNPPLASSAAVAVMTDGTYLLSTAGLKVAGTQVMGTQQTGLGTTLATYTYSGTYAIDLPKLQALHNKVIAIETILRAHGLATT